MYNKRQRDFIAFYNACFCVGIVGLSMFFNYESGFKFQLYAFFAYMLFDTWYCGWDEMISDPVGIFHHTMTAISCLGAIFWHSGDELVFCSILHGLYEVSSIPLNLYRVYKTERLAIIFSLFFTVFRVGIGFPYTIHHIQYALTQGYYASIGLCVLNLVLNTFWFWKILCLLGRRLFSHKRIHPNKTT